MAADFLHLSSHVHEHGNTVHRAGRIADGTLGVLACRLDGLHGHAQVAYVVQGVEDAEYIHAVGCRTRHEGTDHVIGVVAVAQRILAAQQHLQPGIGQGLAQSAQALPGVLLEEAHTGVERRPAPHLQGPEADIVELPADREHIIRAHAGGEQGLMGVAQDGLGDFYFCHGLEYPCIAHKPAWATTTAAKAAAMSCRRWPVA